MGSKLAATVLDTIVPPRSLAVYWIGQGGFILKTSEQRVIYIDPYLSDCVERIEGLVRLVPAPILPSEVRADIILLTHDHIDHLDPDVILEVSKASGAYIVGPTSCARHLADLGVDPAQVVELNRWEITELLGVRIAAVYAAAGEPDDGVGYVIKVDGISTYITGDTTYVPELETMRIALPDILITCINGNEVYGNLYINEGVFAIVQSIVEGRLKSLGLELPPCPKPVGAYVLATEASRFVFASGQTPIVGDKLVYRGKVDSEISVEQGYEAAGICALRCLAELKSAVGSLDRVERIVKVTGYVNSAPGFGDQPKVVNGASELLEKVFGEKGKHARAAIGVAELPGGAPVEIELIALVK